MLPKGPAKKVTIFVNEDTKYHITSLHEAILKFLLHKGVAGATVTHAAAGFGPHHVLHTPDIESLSEHLPVKIEFVESAAKSDEVLPTLYDMVNDGLIEVQDTTIVKAATKERPEPRQPHERKAGPAKLMRIFLGESDRWHDEPLYDAIVKRLAMMDVAGATVYRGILGYGAKRHTHKTKFLRLSQDLPIMISVIDSEEKLAAAAETIEAMMQDGLIVFSDVDIIRFVHSHPDKDVASAKP